jgi:large subunit ribosomal protein L5
MSQLKEKYKKEVVPQIMERLQFKNVMQVPRLKKIVLNIGLGEAITNAKALEGGENDLAAIAGQHPVITRSKRSISAFRLRVGMAIGVMVTLRGQRMWDFYEKLVTITLPRVREFSGLSRNSFDGRGNYTLGFKEQIAFPEIEFDKVDKIRGMEVVIVTSAKTDEEGRTLLELLGMPFVKE